MSKEANIIVDKSLAKERLLAAIESRKGLFLIIVVVLAVAFLAFIPTFPQISGSIETQLGSPRFSLLSNPTMTKLTAIQASSITKNQLFVLEGITNSQTDFTLTVTVYYGNQFVWSGTEDSLPTGQYFFSVVLYPRIEESNLVYSVILTATFPDGTTAQIVSPVAL